MPDGNPPEPEKGLPIYCVGGTILQFQNASSQRTMIDIYINVIFVILHVDCINIACSSHC